MSSDKPNSLKEFLFFSILIIMLVIASWFLLRKPLMLISFKCSFYMFIAYQNLGWLMTTTEYSTLQAAIRYIPTLNHTQYGMSSLMTLMEVHGYVLRWVAIPGMLWWGWQTKKGTVRFKFRRNIKDVYDLIEIQSKHFPASAIIKGKNLLSTPLNLGPWATFALPLDFALDNSFLWTSKKIVTSDDLPDEKAMIPIPPFDHKQKLQPFPVKRKMLPSHRYVCFSYERANAAFSAQLGPLWSGADALPPMIKALYATFCAQAAGEQKVAWAMIEQLAFSFKEGERNKDGKLISPHYADTTGTNELLEKYGSHPKIKEIHQVHAHTINIITATLALARSKGRLMHANFLWVKPVDRTLWYSLCGQGGQTSYWESAGAWAHAQIEQLMVKKIPVPMVAGAVDAMRDTMSREHWIDPGDYSEEAQQRMVKEANDILDASREKKQRKPNSGSLLGSGMSGNAAAAAARNKQKQRDDEP